MAISYRLWIRSSDTIWSCNSDGLNEMQCNVSLDAELRFHLTSVVTKQLWSKLLMRGHGSSYWFDIFYLNALTVVNVEQPISYSQKATDCFLSGLLESASAYLQYSMCPAHICLWLPAFYYAV